MYFVWFVLVYPCIDEKRHVCRVLVHVLCPCIGGTPLCFQVNKVFRQVVLSVPSIVFVRFGLAGLGVRKGTDPSPNLLSKCHCDRPDRSNPRIKGWEHKCLEGDKAQVFPLQRHTMDILKGTYLFGLLGLDM